MGVLPEMVYGLFAERVPRSGKALAASSRPKRPRSDPGRSESAGVVLAVGSPACRPSLQTPHPDPLPRGERGKVKQVEGEKGKS